MATKDRVFQHERQPLLPTNQAYRLINQRDDEREARNPLQLSLLPDLQPDLFVPEASAPSAAEPHGDPAAPP